MTEASIFPSYAQYQIRSQSGQTSETNKEHLKILKMATIENLPQELIDNPIAEEPSIFKNLDETDIINTYVWYCNSLSFLARVLCCVDR